MFVPLKQLRFGNDINVRAQADRTTDIESLANSIAHLGLILPLSVLKTGDDEYTVIDGNRRLSALMTLHGATSDEPVEISIKPADTSEANLTAMSLSANIERLPLHPMDQFEAFNRMAEKGATFEAIATAFMIKPRQVEQRMALGALHHDVKQMYREGQLQDREIQQLTRLPADDQIDVIKQAGGYRWRIGEVIHARLDDKGMHWNSPIARFIGRDAYVAAGGTFLKDLFVEEGTEKYADAALLQKLASEKLANVRERLEAEGWKGVRMVDGWVGHDYYEVDPEGDPDLNDQAKAKIEQLQKEAADLEGIAESEDGLTEEEDDKLARILERIDEINDEAKQWTAEQRAQLYVVISNNYEISRGMQARDEAKAERNAADAGSDGESEAAKQPDKEWSSALVMDLKGYATHAAAHAIISSPAHALRLLALHMLTSASFSNLKYEIGSDWTTNPHAQVIGWPDHPYDKTLVQLQKKIAKKDLAGAMKAMFKLTDDQVIEIIAYFFGRSLRQRSPDHEIMKYLDDLGLLKIREVLTPDEELLGRLTKPQLQAVADEIATSVGTETLAIAPIKKGEAVKRVLAMIPSDWVPGPIRPVAKSKRGED